MSDVQTQIGKYDADTKSVLVTFTRGDIVHERSVNAVLTAQGQYDAEATAERVAQVATGVAHKIACGAILLSSSENK